MQVCKPYSLSYNNANRCHNWLSSSHFTDNQKHTSKPKIDLPRMLSLDKYKDVTTTRGYKYHYYHASAQGTKPTLLFTHGFPSTSQDWHRVVPHFEQQGYGIIVPDTLGYGGTDKPTDPVAYKATLLAKDIIEIIDAEKLDKVIAIGHDWQVAPVTQLSRTVF